VGIFLAEFLSSIDEKMDAMNMELAELRQLKSSAKTVSLSSLDVSDEALASLIRRQIAIYDADKTNMPDYALENSGTSPWKKSFGI